MSVDGIRTNEIVDQFIRAQLLQNGFDWTPKETRKPKTNPSLIKTDQIDLVCHHLNGISKELQEFIKASFDKTFAETISIDLSDFDYEGLKTMADELFANGVTWSGITTLLLHAACLACKAMESHDNTPIDHHESNGTADIETTTTMTNDTDSNSDSKVTGGVKFVSKIADLVTLYIDENLMQWINEQGGWSSIKDYMAERRGSGWFGKGGLDTQSFRHLKVAAFAALLGGLYLCSKSFIVQ